MRSGPGQKPEIKEIERMASDGELPEMGLKIATEMEAENPGEAWTHLVEKIERAHPSTK